MVSLLVQHDCFTLLFRVNIYSSSSSAKSLCHSALPSLSLSLPSFLPSLPSPHCLSHLLYVSMAERDQGQLWLVLSVRGILWKQYITSNSLVPLHPALHMCSLSFISLSLVLVQHVVIPHMAPASSLNVGKCKWIGVCGLFHTYCRGIALLSRGL